MSTATTFHDVLEKTTRHDMASGLLLQSLTEILRYRLAQTQSDSKANAATIQPMVEMYLKSTNKSYRITTSGGGVTVRGLNWKSDEAREFSSILTSGIQGSVEQATKAQSLYSKLWPSDSE